MAAAVLEGILVKFSVCSSNLRQYINHFDSGACSIDQLVLILKFFLLLVENGIDMNASLDRLLIQSWIDAHFQEMHPN